MTLRAGLVALLAAALGACHQQKTYPLSPEAAKAVLVGTRIPDLAFGMVAHSGPGEAISDGVEWTLLREREGAQPAGDGWNQPSSPAVLVLTAHFTAVDGGTQVAVDVVPAAGAGKAPVGRGLAEKPAVAEMFRTIASEQVDATLTHRYFDFANIRQSIVVAMTSMLPEIRKQMDAAGEESQRQNQEKIDNAYKAAGQGPPDPSGFGARPAPANPWQ